MDLENLINMIAPGLVFGVILAFTILGIDTAIEKIVDYIMDKELKQNKK